MKKLSLSLNILAIQGAQRMASKSGKDIIVIDLAASRMKPHANGKVYLNLDAVERRDGADDYGKTHFVCEPITKEERESGLKLPIIGNGKEWGDMAEVKKLAARPPPKRAGDEPEPSSWKQDQDDDDIPF